MNDKEIRGIIRKSENIELYKNVDVSFNFPYINYQETFTDLNALLTFVSQQISGWESYNEGIPPEFQKSKLYFINIREAIINFLNHDIDVSDGTFNHFFQPVKTAIASLRDFPFTYNSEEAKFLVSVYQQQRDSFSGAYNYLANNVGPSFIRTRVDYYGVYLAQQFDSQDKSKLGLRKPAEEASYKNFKHDFISYLSESKANLEEHIKSADENYESHITHIDTLKTEKESLINEWFEETKTNYSSFHTAAQTKKEELEATYNELLKLKAPAKYWGDRADKLKEEGKTFMGWLIALVALGSISLFLLLLLSPDDMLTSIFSNNKAAAIRWSIVFITFISFLFFGIRALTRAMFSSYHLARDAEEREQLTYLYLALSKEATVDKEDRHLVLQSLFSRSDSGLLKEDSSPTMPGVNNIVSGN